MSIGTVTIGIDADEQRTIELTDMLRCGFKGHRLATIAKDEEGAYLLAIENPASTGRNPESKMYLSEDSFIALLSTIHLFLDKKNINMAEKIKSLAADDDNFYYEYKFSEEKGVSNEE